MLSQTANIIRMSHTPESLIEAVRYFSDLKVCNQYMRGIKWPDGEPVCHHCGSVAVYELSTRPVLKCRDCKKQFSYKVGTIFEDSPLGLDKWFVAVWSIANAKNGISSHELGRALGVTQKTAWFMLHRVREAMKTGEFRKLKGVVESDETFIGGAAENMHKHIREKKIKGRGAVGKRIVHGMLERGGEVRANVVESTEANELQGAIVRNVEFGAAVYTDAHKSYEGLSAAYAHEAVDHAVEYVRGQVHTNGLENFWALFKRCIKGTYIQIAPFHLQRYADEEVFRFNARKDDDGGRFAGVMKRVNGRRMTWRRLCEVDGCGFMGLQ
jgi:transposase-like protein